MQEGINVSTLRSIKKKLIRNDSLISKMILWAHNCFFGHNRIRGRHGNRIEIRGYIRNSTITIGGADCLVIVEPGAQIVHSSITINKDRGTVLVKKNG